MRLALLLLALGSFGDVGRGFSPPTPGSGRAETAPYVSSADAEWCALIERAQHEQKPLVVFFTTPGCERCAEFERVSVPHPTIERRLPAVIFAVRPAEGPDPGVALYDYFGIARARWPIVPDTTNFGMILDAAIAVTPHFQRAAQLSAPDADLEIATALARLGRNTDARTALGRARANGSPETRQAAIVAAAVLDANAGQGRQALAELEQVIGAPATPKLAADAQHAIDAIRGVRDVPRKAGAIQLLPLERQVVRGRHSVRTHVASADVSRVVFFLDGREVTRVERPPFSATLDFGDVPERRAIRVVAYDRKGRERGRDERIVNHAGETFWLRFVTPREGPADGATHVSMNLRVPPSRRVRRVAISWNDAERKVLTAAPWEATVRIPEGQLGVLRAVAELDDGRTSEDAVLLNAGGAAGRAEVQLVELPLTIVSKDGPTPPLAPERIIVREGTKVRRVEAVATAAETPLTVGLLIDVSDSMQETLPDLQEAAIRFLETMLGERDRAFLVSFDSRARLLQPATADVAELRRQVMKVYPNGLTALHDAMVLGLLQFEGIKGRRAMIVFSDGLDRTSEYRASEVEELARRVNVPIHVIAAMPEYAEAEGEALQRLAAPTGGTSHRLRELSELPNVYARIEAALRAQVLAFVRTDPATRENEWRGVRVEVRDLEVYAPEGYYAAW